VRRWSASLNGSSDRKISKATAKEPEMAIYFLAVLLVLVVIYLFYAVIHPERF
jgi:K+-transporting ATPase KdpF subunit